MGMKYPASTTSDWFAGGGESTLLVRVTPGAAQKEPSTSTTSARRAALLNEWELTNFSQQNPSPALFRAFSLSVLSSLRLGRGRASSRHSTHSPCREILSFSLHSRAPATTWGGSSRKAGT